ncbi:MAG: AEC family transporter [Candidatus Theseobacter exili]|nr:AEC family transporter [Candidatus Theseobacter exili]
MTFDQSVIQSISILIIMIFAAMGLRKIGIIKEEQGELFARIITQYTLPALIFSALSSSQFDMQKLLLAVVMIISQFICALLAWGVSVLLNLSKPKKGALILASTFTSSGFLGYAVVKEIYLNNNEALSDAAIVSELGVASLIFTLGILIAIHFGIKDASPHEKRTAALKFFHSPIFFSLILGTAFSFVPIPHDHWIIAGFYKILRTIGAANTLLVTLTIGVMLHFKDLRKVLPIVLIACFIKLFIQPLLSYFQSELLNFPKIWHQIVVLESSMPTAAMTAVFSKRYGCDSELTTILVFATFTSSVFTVITMVFLLG